MTSVRRPLVRGGIAVAALATLSVLLAAEVRDGVRAVVEMCQMGTTWEEPLFPERPVSPEAVVAPWCREVGGRSLCVPRSRRIVRENRLPGTTDWCIPPSAPAGIEGYADRTSVQQGDPLTLYVSSEAPRFHVDVFRLGHYGGLGARRVWRSPELSTFRQAGPRLDPATNTIEAGWRPSLTIRVPPGWTPGVYLLKLVGSDGSQQYVPLVVRDDGSRSPLVVQLALATYQAYNRWGGYSLYYGPGRDPHRRARVVSFDRPYDRNRGSGDLLQGGDQPLIALVERLGLDVTYWTDLDLHRRPQLLSGHRALVVLGHSEYWSASMRAAATAARDGGVNLLFLQANDVFRQIRVAPSPLGADRRIIGYKAAREDPLFGVRDREVTVDWRLPPVSRPETDLLGAAFECNPVFADMVIRDASGWIFHGTGVRNGDVLPTLVGYTEFDRVHPDLPTPANIQILARSPVVCRGRSGFSDMTYYTSRSGAGVLDTGTTAWVYRLELPCVLSGRCSATARMVNRMTENILSVFGSGPSGFRFPSRPNLAEFGIDLAAPIEP